MQKRNKAGGIVDRRIGENDPTMAPEDRMLERFTHEKTKRARGGTMFNLEDDDELTHFGATLSAAPMRELGLGKLQDEFAMSDDEVADSNPRKRPLEDGDESAGSDDEGKPEKKKSKAEVMKEVISKSKFHKYERQKLKEEDEDEREKLDAQMGELWGLLGVRQPSTTENASGSNNIPLGEPGLPAPESKKEEFKPEEKKVSRNYDQAVREMMFDKRSKPADREKTEEEKAAAEFERLKRMEEMRLKRMRGEEVEEEKVKEKKPRDDDDMEEDEEDEGDRVNEAEQYGLGQGVQSSSRVQENPEDYLDGDYALSDDDYVDVDEEGLVDGDQELSDDESDMGEAEADSDEDDFIADVAPGQGVAVKGASGEAGSDKLAFTFPCPQTHAEMLEITKGIAVEDTHTVVERIRALHHAKLKPENKGKLQNFAIVLLDHIIYLANLTSPRIPFSEIDFLIRHLHAMTKAYPEPVSTAFRGKLKEINESRMNDEIRAGDLMLLTAVASIFPTSDHFHPVVTPSMLLIARWLGQIDVNSVKVMAIGTYLATLAAQYQRLSKRYIPESVSFTLKALSLLAPVAQAQVPGEFSYTPSNALRIKNAPKDWEPRKLSFADMYAPTAESPLAITHTLFGLLDVLIAQYGDRTAFIEIFEPALSILKHFSTKACTAPLGAELKVIIFHEIIQAFALTNLQKNVTAFSKDLEGKLAQKKLARRPLELHHHKPLPLPSNVPKFEEDYSMDKHYDPNAERREASKLKAEHKREKKAATREIRKDNQFIASVKLKEDRANSEAYHKKMARLTAMIQSEEGAAANEYKREAAARGRK
jgi:nucleolar protein 14